MISIDRAFSKPDTFSWNSIPESIWCTRINREITSRCSKQAAHCYKGADQRRTYEWKASPAPGSGASIVTHVLAAVRRQLDISSASFGRCIATGGSCYAPRSSRSLRSGSYSALDLCGWRATSPTLRLAMAGIRVIGDLSELRPRRRRLLVALPVDSPPR
jgi:hypothetical protein